MGTERPTKRALTVAYGDLEIMLAALIRCALRTPESCVTEIRVELAGGRTIPVIATLTFWPPTRAVRLQDGGAMWTEDKAKRKCSRCSTGRADSGGATCSLAVSPLRVLEKQRPEAKCFQVARRPSDAFLAVRDEPGAWKGSRRACTR